MPVEFLLRDAEVEAVKICKALQADLQCKSLRVVNLGAGCHHAAALPSSGRGFASGFLLRCDMANSCRLRRHAWT